MGKMSGSELHARSQNKLEEKHLQDKLKQLSFTEFQCREKNLQEMRKWRKFLLENGKNSGWISKSLRPESSLGLDDFCSVANSNDRRHCAPFIFTVQRPWAYSFNSGSHNQVYKELTEAGENSKKILRSSSPTNSPRNIVSSSRGQTPHCVPSVAGMKRARSAWSHTESMLPLRRVDLPIRPKTSVNEYQMYDLCPTPQTEIPLSIKPLAPGTSSKPGLTLNEKKQTDLDISRAASLGDRKGLTLLKTMEAWVRSVCKEDTGLETLQQLPSAALICTHVHLTADTSLEGLITNPETSDILNQVGKNSDKKCHHMSKQRPCTSASNKDILQIQCPSLDHNFLSKKISDEQMPNLSKRLTNENLPFSKIQKAKSVNVLTGTTSPVEKGTFEITGASSSDERSYVFDLILVTKDKISKLVTETRTNNEDLKSESQVFGHIPMKSDMSMAFEARHNQHGIVDSSPVKTRETTKREIIPTIPGTLGFRSRYKSSVCTSTSTSSEEHRKLVSETRTHTSTDVDDKNISRNYQLRSKEIGNLDRNHAINNRNLLEKLTNYQNNRLSHQKAGDIHIDPEIRSEKPRKEASSSNMPINESHGLRPGFSDEECFQWHENTIKTSDGSAHNGHANAELLEARNRIQETSSLETFSLPHSTIMQTTVTKKLMNSGDQPPENMLHKFEQKQSQTEQTSGAVTRNTALDSGLKTNSERNIDNYVHVIRRDEVTKPGSSFSVIDLTDMDKPRHNRNINSEPILNKVHTATKPSPIEHGVNINLREGDTDIPGPLSRNALKCTTNVIRSHLYAKGAGCPLSAGLSRALKSVHREHNPGNLSLESTGTHESGLYRDIEYKGIRIRNYVYPHLRYKTAIVDRRKRSTVVLWSAPSRTRTALYQYQNLPKMPFTKHARQKALDQLVQDNHILLNNRLVALNSAALRQRIDAFLMSVQPFCQSQKK